MSIAIGSDHKGVELKEVVVKTLRGWGYDVADLGPSSTESCNYAEYANAVCKRISRHTRRCSGQISQQSFCIFLKKAKNADIEATETKLCWGDYPSPLTPLTKGRASRSPLWNPLCGTVSCYGETLRALPKPL